MAYHFAKDWENKSIIPDIIAIAAFISGILIPILYGRKNANYKYNNCGKKFYSDYFNADPVPVGLVRKNIQMRGDKVYIESSVPGSFDIEIYEFDFLDLMMG